MSKSLEASFFEFMFVLNNLLNEMNGIKLY